MTVEQLIENLQKVPDQQMTIYYPDNSFDPTGTVEVENLTPLYDGFNVCVGWVLV